ncbi:MAG: DUF4342 domain-containing protein [Clostridiales bacterium]|nr:DUF4342 domain-containing protein [Clostridiales bacterium]
MATLEQADRLRERANVSYDEAKAALDATGGDILEALIYLEKRGKAAAPAGGGYYNSEKPAPAAPTQENHQNHQQADYQQPRHDTGERFSDLLKRFGNFCVKLIKKGNANSFEVSRDGESVFSLPVTVLVLLFIFTFWITLPLLVIGLFFGFHYRFYGPDLGKQSVNKVMDSASSAADSIKKSVNEEFRSEK